MQQTATEQPQFRNKYTAGKLAEFYGKYYALKNTHADDLLDVFGFVNTETMPTDNPHHPYFKFIALEEEYNDFLKYSSKEWRKEISLSSFLYQDLGFGRSIPDDFKRTLADVFEE